MARRSLPAKVVFVQTALFVFTLTFCQLGLATLSDAKLALRQKQFESGAALLLPLARAGEVEAQYLLASLYRSGNGVEKNHKQAFAWLEKASAKLHFPAQYNLGVMYENGWGTAASLDSAEKWYRASAAGGYRQAKQRIALWDSLLEPIALKKLSKKSVLLKKASQAIRANNRRELIRVLQAKLSVDARENGRTLLAQAIIFSADQCLTALLGHKASLTDINPSHESALSLAIRLKQIAMVGPLIDAGAKINGSDEQGNFPIHNAVRLREKGLMRLLLNSGADVEKLDSQQMNALDIAERIDDKAIVALLRKAGATHSNRFIQTYQTSLTSLADPNWIEAQRKLLSEQNPSYAEWPLINLAAFLGKEKLVDSLLAKGQSPLTLDKENITAIARAIMGGHRDVVSSMLKLSESSYRLPADQLVGIAIDYKQVDMALSILKLAGQLETPTTIHATNLVSASRLGSEKLIIALLVYPSLLFDQAGSVDTANDFEKEAFIWVTKHGLIDVLPRFNIRDSLINGYDENRRSPLWYCAILGHEEICRLLLLWGSDATSVDENSQTLLMLAAQFGHINIVRQFIDHGLSLNGTDSAGMTALFKAAIYGNPSVVTLLLEQGSDVEWRDSESRTALMLASELGNQKVVEMLVKYGANIRRRDNKGLTAVDYAKSAGFSDLARYLEGPS